ncbi:MAG: pyrimidine 5'-nucleotidase [Alphaproteobacteria bacterium]|nr:pyrimidine 5'-nucleotidase [Alphaproteobacteria bacterium]
MESIALKPFGFLPPGILGSGALITGKNPGMRLNLLSRAKRHASSRPMQDKAVSRPAGPRLDGIETWVFDLDNTLYPANCNLFAQVDQRIGAFVSRLLGLPPDQARVVQKGYLAKYGTTLRGLMVEHGLEPSEYLDFVHDIDVMAIPPDPLLDRALDRLPGRKLVFTNGTVMHAERVLGRLGVARHFEAVFDIHAADYVPKPEPVVYDWLLRRHAIQPRRAMLFEDIARNLKPAHDLGMTTAWVRVDWAWAQPGDDMAHVHHVIEELTPWLHRAADALPQPSPAAD